MRYVNFIFEYSGTTCLVGFIVMVRRFGSIQTAFFAGFLLLVFSALNPAFADDNNALVTEASAPEADSRQWLENVNADSFAEKTSADELNELQDLRAIANSIQSLKKDVVDLNKDLQRMEEKMLFPSNTRYSVFVSLTSGQFFKLESIKLKIDGKLVSSHVYSEKQRRALERGGIHKLYVTNMNEGVHTVTAFFSGLAVDGRPYKRAANLEFEKSIGSEFLELAIIDDGSVQEPVFSLKRW